MVCRHTANDPACSSSPANRQLATLRYEQEQAVKKALAENTPDPDNYLITKFERVGPHVVMSVQYPSCKRCAYEGNKVMVFLNASESQVVQWRRIDPHFRDPKLKTLPDSAPSPSARFPASDDGWKDALAYAQYKNGSLAAKDPR